MIRIEHLSVHFRDFHLGEIDLVVEKNEFFVLMGPTGAGKTVLLEAIAGLVSLDSGMIRIAGVDVTRMPPERRGVGIVYQDQGLFPHMNVLHNITYGLKFCGIGRAEGQKRLDRLVELLSISSLLLRLPVNLSGGEKQRVALARALIVQPHVLLLDEPLSAIDPGFREDIRQALKRLHRASGTTFLMVTHDFGEALTLADRGAVIHRGVVEQAGPIERIFRAPASLAVAEFVGMKNLFIASVEKGRPQIHRRADRMAASTGNHHRHAAIRPEDLVVSRTAPDQVEEPVFRGKVSAVIGGGFGHEVCVQAGDLTFTAWMTRRALIDQKICEGVEVFVSFDSTALHVW